MRPLMTNSVTGSAQPAWPRETRAACAFTFDVDAETLWMARGVTEPVTLSQGRFGVLEAVPRILAILRAAQIHGTFFIPAWVAAHYPDTVRAIAGEGHEIGCHGDEHESVTKLCRAREQEILKNSVEDLTELTRGRCTIGFTSPAWQPSTGS